MPEKIVNAYNLELALPRGFVTPKGNYCPLVYRGNGTYELLIPADEKYVHAPTTSDAKLLAEHGRAV